VTFALVFGGQGTEMPGMGLRLAGEYPGADALLRHAGEVCGVDAHRVLGRGGPDFARTSVIQPLLTAVALGAWAALAEAWAATYTKPSHVVGHSLGELAAWSAAGAFDARAAIELAAVRGRVMEREAALHPGGMIAVTCSADEIDGHLLAGRAAGALCVAGVNTADEYVLSGDAAALAAVAARARTTRLSVSGAWHSPAMAGGVDEVRAAVPAIHTTHATVVTNRTGNTVRRGEDIASLLAEQLVRPVLWRASLQSLHAGGVRHHVILGPGKVMRSLIVRNLDPALRARTRTTIIEHLADVHALAAEVAG
jgi:[acyl-carrier-protein] S-malonyltransferase